MLKIFVHGKNDSSVESRDTTFQVLRGGGNSSKINENAAIAAYYVMSYIWISQMTYHNCSKTRTEKRHRPRSQDVPNCLKTRIFEFSLLKRNSWLPFLKQNLIEEDSLDYIFETSLLNLNPIFESRLMRICP